MINPIIRGVLALALLTPLTAYGGDHKKCTLKVDDCLNAMVTKLKSTGFIGVELEESKKGALVITKIVPGAPAEKAGIQVGDELMALNGIPFSKESHHKMEKVKKPGKEVTCTIKRNGANKDIRLTLVPMPADLMAKYIGEHMMSHAKKTVHVSTR